MKPDALHQYPSVTTAKLEGAAKMLTVAFGLMAQVATCTVEMHAATNQ